MSMPSLTFGAKLNPPAPSPSPSPSSSSSYFGARDMATRMARIASSATPSSSGTGIVGAGIEGSLTSTAGSFTFGSSGMAIFFGASAGAFLGAGGGGLGLAGVSSALGGGGLGFAGVGAAAFVAVASGADSLAGDSAFFFSAGAAAACGGASSTPGPTQKGATALARRSSSSMDAFNAAPSSLDLGPSARSRRVAALAAAAFRSYATLPPRYSSTSSDSDMPVFSASFTAPEAIASIFGRVIAAVSASWDGPGGDAVAIASDRVLAGNRRFRQPRLCYHHGRLLGRGVGTGARRGVGGERARRSRACLGGEFDSRARRCGSGVSLGRTGRAMRHGERGSTIQGHHHHAGWSTSFFFCA